jgi:hypothetical protein
MTEDNLEKLEAHNGEEIVNQSNTNEQDKERAKQANIGLAQINLLAGIRTAVMCKIIYEVALEKKESDPAGYNYARVLLASALTLLVNYPEGPKYYREAISLGTIDEDVKRYKKVLERLEKADKDGDNIVLDL